MKRDARERAAPRGHGVGCMCRAIVRDEKDLAPWGVRRNYLVHQAGQLRTRVPGRTHAVHCAENWLTLAPVPPMRRRVYIRMRADETSGQTAADGLGITRATVQSQVAQV